MVQWSKSTFELESATESKQDDIFIFIAGTILIVSREVQLFIEEVSHADDRVWVLPITDIESTMDFNRIEDLVGCQCIAADHLIEIREPNQVPAEGSVVVGNINRGKAVIVAIVQQQAACDGSVIVDLILGPKAEFDTIEVVTVLE